MKIPENSIMTLLKNKTVYNLELWQIARIIGEHIDVKAENIEITLDFANDKPKIILEVNNERI